MPADLNLAGGRAGISVTAVVAGQQQRVRERCTVHTPAPAPLAVIIICVRVVLHAFLVFGVGFSGVRTVRTLAYSTS
mgnify:CR=1 FL=1